MAHKIKSERQKKGLSQTQLARLVGLSRLTISKYERNQSSPKLSHLSKISRALGVRTADLLPDESLDTTRAA